MAMALAVSAASFARRAAAFSAVQHALRQVQQTRNFGAAAAGAGGRLGFTFSQAHCGTLPGAVQHLVNLTRQLSGSPPFQAGAAAIPGAVPGTGGGSAEQSTGVAIPPAAGSAETDTGVSSSPGTSGAETSTGLGQPGQTSPAEVGTGLGDPAETPSAEVHLGGRSPGEGASAEQTADPTRDDQTPSGSEKDLSGLPGWTRESPEAAVAGSADNVPSSGTGDTHGSSSSSGSPKRQPLGSDEEWPKRIVRADKPGLLPAEVRNFIIQTRMRFWSRGIQEVVEQQFDPDEFLESAKDAYWMVTKLFNEREYDILKDMVSERLLKAFRETHEEFAAQGTEFSLVDQDVTDAYIVDMGYWDREWIAHLDPEWAAAAGPEPQDNAQPAGDSARRFPSNPFLGSWLYVSVEFCGTQTTRTQLIGTGEVLQIMEDQRRHTWRFARGPLPAQDLPVRELSGYDWRVMEVID